MLSSLTTSKCLALAQFSSGMYHYVYMKTCQDFSLYEIAPVISFFPCKWYVFIFDQLIHVQNWTGKLYQVKQENLSVCFRRCVLFACRSWCDICSFCSSIALTHVQSGTANQSFRSFSGIRVSRQSFFHPVFVSWWFLLMCLYWMALLFDAIYSLCQPRWLPNFLSLICLLEAPCLTGLRDAI